MLQIFEIKSNVNIKTSSQLNSFNKKVGIKNIQNQFHLNYYST